MDHDQPTHKIRVPIAPVTPLAQVERVLANGPFLAFARILGLRIMRGKSTSAFRMLKSIGATALTAHGIIDGWEAAEANEDAAPLLTPHELGAVYFSRHIDDLTRYEWIELLSQAVSDSAQGPAPPTPKSEA